MTLKDADKIKEAIMDSDDFVGCSDDIMRVIDSVPEVVIDTDTISRSEAIKAIDDCDWCECGGMDTDGEWIYKENVVELLELIEPSQAATSQIIHCKDCKYREHYRESGYICVLDTGDPYMTGRNAEDDDWFCADAERKEVTE